MQSLQHKRSGVAGKKPTPEQLQVGELAIQLADHVIYTKDKNNAVVQISVSPETHNALSTVVSNNKKTTDATIAANKTEAANNLAAAKSELTETINTKDAAINKRADGINTAVLNLQKTVTANKTDADNKITALTDTVNTNNTAINNKVNTTNTNVSNLTKTVTANKTDADNKITTLTSTVTANDTAINKRADGINTAVINLKTTVTNNKSDADNKITALTNRVNEIDGTVDGLAGDSKVIQPLPDVWIPFNDSLDMITGFSPSYKKIVIGEDEITMPSDKTVKFKRASTATYINKSGVFSVAGIDEPRFEKDGLLIEGQRTNYFTKSNIPSEWAASSNIDKSLTGVDEFGFTYAKMKVKPALVGQTSGINLHACSASKGFDASGDEKYSTISCRVKAPDGIRVRLRFEKYDGSVYTFLGDAYLTPSTMTIEKTGGAANRITASAIKDPVTGWIFFEATLQAIEGESLIGGMIQYAPKKSAGTEAEDYVYLATPQFENGGCASSFIVTTTTPATRASDMVTIPTENNIYSKPLTCLVEVNRNWGDIPPNVAPRIFDFSGVPPIESITYAFNTTEKYYGQLYMQTYKESTSTYVSSVFTGRTDVRKFVGGFNVYSNGTKRVVTNGEATRTMKTEWTGVKTRTFIRMGGQTTSGTRHLFGHLRNLRLWHKELTDAQMRESVE